jgi:hypothetical protein
VARDGGNVIVSTLTADIRSYALLSPSKNRFQATAIDISLRITLRTIEKSMLSIEGPTDDFGVIVLSANKICKMRH